MQRKSLHDEIYQPGSGVLLSEINNIDVNGLNAHGMSYMQLAAQERKLVLLLALINAGANLDQVYATANVPEEFKRSNAYCIRQSNKTPLYHSLENGHYLLAEILLALGANRELVLTTARELNQPEIISQLEGCVVNPMLLTALAVFAMSVQFWNLLTILADRMDPEEQREDISAVIQFAFMMMANRPNEFNEGIRILLKKLDGKPLLFKPNVYTATFFAALQQSELIKELNQTDEDWVLALNQLQSQGHNISYCLAAATEEAKKQFLTGKLVYPHFEHSDLQPRQIHAYSLISAGLVAQAGIFCESAEDYNPIVNVALEQKNFAALYSCYYLTKEAKLNLPATFIKKQQSELLKFWLCLTGTPIDCLSWFSSPDEQREALKFVGATLSSELSQLQQYVRVCIDNMKQPLPELMDIIKPVVAEDTELLVATLKRCLQNRYAIPDLEFALVKAHVESDEERAEEANPKKHTIQLLKKLRPREQAIVAVVLRRFGFEVIKEVPADLEEKKPEKPTKKGQPNFAQLDNKIWKHHIIPSLSTHELKRMPTVSGVIQEHTLEAVQEIKSNPVWEENNKKALSRIELENKREQALNDLEAFKRFRQVIDEDLANRSCFEGRLPQVGIVLGSAASLAFFVWVFKVFIGSCVDLNSVKNKEDALKMSDGKTCYEKHACEYSWGWSSICRDLCIEQQDIEVVFVFSLMGFICNFAWMIPLFDYVLNYDWNDRFSHLEITDLSEETQNEFEEVKRLAPHKNDRIIHLENVRSIYKEVKHQEDRLQQIADNIESTYYAEIKANEDKRASEEEEVRQQNLWFRQQTKAEKVTSQTQLLTQFSGVLANPPQEDGFEVENLLGDELVDSDDVNAFKPPVYRPPKQ